MRVGNNCWPFFHPQSLRDSPGGALGTVFPKPLASLRTACAFHSPPVASRQPQWGIGDRIPQTPCVASHCVRFSFTPQSLRDSPRGALGTVFPKPLASLRTACAFHSPPVASRQPRWGIGDRIPQTPCVASLRGDVFFCGVLFMFL